MKALILAGGSGTRLWPLSRYKNPKQFLQLYRKKSLLRLTYERLQGVFLDKDIWLATASEHKLRCKKEVPEIKNYSLEPTTANTAPAIGLALLHLRQVDPKSIVVTINSDHYIGNRKEYLRILKQGEKLVRNNLGKVVLVGVKTEYPETGYGYIRLGKMYTHLNKDKVYYVDSFIEKPNLTRAKIYHQSDRYLWNPAIFIFSAEYMWELFKKYLPKHFKLLQQMEKIYPDQEKIDKLFKKFPKISIDYGILEKAHKDLLVIPASFGWSDIGSWQSVSKLFTKKNNNLVEGDFIGIDSYHNIIFSSAKKLIATIGIKNSVVIQADDAVLIADKSRSQDVKRIVKILRKKNKNNFL